MIFFRSTKNNSTEYRVSTIRHATSKSDELDHHGKYNREGESILFSQCDSRNERLVLLHEQLREDFVPARNVCRIAVGSEPGIIYCSFRSSSDSKIHRNVLLFARRFQCFSNRKGLRNTSIGLLLYAGFI